MRNPRLDSLRAFAVFSVMLHHYIIVDTSSHTTLDAMMRHGVHLPDLGYHGVQFFFMLSGFLITGILLRARFRNPSDRLGVWKTFEFRRALRIFPPYYALLLGASLVAVGLEVKPLWFPDELPSLLAYRGHVALYSGASLGSMSHLWSLGIEEYFYLFWPVVILAPSRKLIGPSIVCVLLATFAYRTAYTWISPEGWVIIDGTRTVVQVQGEELLIHYSIYGFVPQATILVAGGLLAWVMEERTDIGRKLQSAAAWAASRVWVWLPLMALTCWIWVLVRSVIYDVPLITRGGWDAMPLWKGVLVATELLAYGTAILVAALPRGSTWSRVLELRPLVWIGTVSYGIYLLHLPLLNGLFEPGRALDAFPSPVRFVGYVAATISLAALSWRFFEQPVQRLRERLYPA